MMPSRYFRRRITRWVHFALSVLSRTPASTCVWGCVLPCALPGVRYQGTRLCTVQYDLLVSYYLSNEGFTPYWRPSVRVRAVISATKICSIYKTRYYCYSSWTWMRCVRLNLTTAVVVLLLLLLGCSFFLRQFSLGISMRYSLLRTLVFFRPEGRFK